MASPIRSRRSEPVRAYAEQIEPLQLKEFPGHHDILNETVHREVAAAIVDFIEQAGTRVTHMLTSV